MATLAPYTFNQYFDNNGDPLAGGKVYTYEAGTSTPKATYTDADEGTANANPIILDSYGRADIWLGTGNYKLVIYDSADTLIKTVDDVAGASTGGVVSYDVSTNTSVTEVYDRAKIYCTSSPTLSLLPVADAGDGFEFWVRNEGSGTVTIDPDASETINGASTFTLVQNEWVHVSCDGDEWHIFDNDVVKNNYAGTTAPTAGDDSGDGYSVGSLWIDTTNDEAYRCVDATAAAAVWVNTSLEISDLGSAASANLIDDDTFATATSSNVPSAESTKAYVDTVTEHDIIHLQHTTSSGSGGGGATTGAWTKRTLNTTVVNEISGASVASSVVTLPAGTYMVTAKQVMRATGDSATRLYDTTNTTTLVNGQTNTPSNYIPMPLNGKFTLAGTANVELQYYATSNAGVEDLGASTTIGTNYHADLIIVKIP